MPRVQTDLLAIDRSRASPNHGVRGSGQAQPNSIILHYTGMRDGPLAVDWLCNPASRVSCHYVVAETGAILQLVEEERRAWHAGLSSWAGTTDMNAASIGIEIVNGGHEYGLPPFPDVQIAAVVTLCRDITRRRGIAAERILAHSDIAPNRKRDPGERFPWDVLYRAGVGHWVEPSDDRGGPVIASGAAGELVEQLQRSLIRYGYGLEISGVYDANTETIVRAFQRHFRPARVDGIADAGTCDTLFRLTAALQTA